MIKTINVKGDNSFMYKSYKIKFKYKRSADIKIFFNCNAR